MYKLTDKVLFEQAVVTMAELRKEIERQNTAWYAIIEKLDDTIDEQQIQIEALQARIKESRSDK